MHPKVLLHSRQILSVRPSVCRSSFRQRLDVRAGILTATGPKFAAEAVSVKGTLGEGSYGQVFEVSSLPTSCATPILCIYFSNVTYARALVHAWPLIGIPLSNISEAIIKTLLGGHL